MKMKLSSISCLFAILFLLTTIPSALATYSLSQFCDESYPKIYDITYTLLREGVVTFDARNPPKPIVSESSKGPFVVGKITVATHAGTHVDAPEHTRDIYNQHNRSDSADMLDLHTLIGPVLVVDTPRNCNITAEVLKSLNLPQGLKRVIFKTSNTDRRLMETGHFVSNYTGLTGDAATWLVGNTEIKLIGIDYMSLARHDETLPVHQTLFTNKDIIPVECLNLNDVKPGRYTVYCLPMKLQADGAPVRCILVE